MTVSHRVKFLLLLIVPLMLGAAVVPVAQQHHRRVANRELLEKVKSSQPTDVSRLDALLARGADVNALDEEHLTPLHHAVMNNDGWALPLIERGADVDARALDGHTPLFGAVERGKAKVVRLLLARGANPHLRMRQSGQSVSALMRSEQVVREMRQAGVSAQEVAAEYFIIQRLLRAAAKN